MVRSVCLLRAAGFTWQAHHGGWVLSIIAKGTFDLAPTESRLSDRQEDIVVQDNHWNDDPQRSIYAPTDLAPFKPRADVTVVGHAFSPGGEPVRHLIARVVVGECDKAIEVDSPAAVDVQLRAVYLTDGRDTCRSVSSFIQGAVEAGFFLAA